MQLYVSFLSLEYAGFPLQEIGIESCAFEFLVGFIKSRIKSVSPSKFNRGSSNFGYIRSIGFYTHQAEKLVCMDLQILT